jgi:hypothetical protein
MIREDGAVSPWDGGGSAVVDARGRVRAESGDSLKGEGALGEALTRLVADPARVEALHEVLGPFCHRSRNILNSLKISLYLARRDEAPGSRSVELWAEVETRYRAVEEFYDRLQMLWRPLPQALVRISLSLLLEDRRDSWVAQFAARDRVLRMSAVGKDDIGDYDPNCLGVALDAFVAWRASAGEAGRDAQLSWWAREQWFELEWDEPRKPSRTRARPQVGTSGNRSESLALPLLARVIAAHGGVMELVEPSGRHLRLSWPQMARVAP